MQLMVSMLFYVLNSLIYLSQTQTHTHTLSLSQLFFISLSLSLSLSLSASPLTDPLEDEDELSLQLQSIATLFRFSYSASHKLISSRANELLRQYNTVMAQYQTDSSPENERMIKILHIKLTWIMLLVNAILSVHTASSTYYSNGGSILFIDNSSSGDIVTLADPVNPEFIQLLNMFFDTDSDDEPLFKPGDTNSPQGTPDDSSLPEPTSPLQIDGALMAVCINISSVVMNEQVPQTSFSGRLVRSTLSFLQTATSRIILQKGGNGEPPLLETVKIRCPVNNETDILNITWKTIAVVLRTHAVQEKEVLDTTLSVMDYLSTKYTIARKSVALPIV